MLTGSLKAPRAPRAMMD